MKARQRVESKHTNRSIAFLCLDYYIYACINADSLVDLTSNRCSIKSTERHLKFASDGHQQLQNDEFCSDLVPIALGKYLFSFRTQKSSPVAPIILLCGKLGRCQIMCLNFLERKFSKELHYEKSPRSEFPEIFCFLIFLVLARISASEWVIFSLTSF